MAPRTPSELLDALRELPCGAALLDAVGDADGVWLVGGAVRDLTLGREPRELDVATEGDIVGLVERLGGDARHHERFETATMELAGCRVDVTRTRTETYSAPGALPDVQPAAIDEDLERRDFTVNAIAISTQGELKEAPGAHEDLAAQRLRVLHEKSFSDDPTRLWRLVRYAVRLGFAVDERTSELAADAVAAGALETVSGDRLGAELRLALLEPDPLATLHAAQNLGLVKGLELDPGVAGRALMLVPREGRADLVVLGAVLPDARWADGLGFTAGELRILRRCVELEPLRAALASEVAELVRDEPVEAVAVAGARGSMSVAERWLLEWRHVELEISGDDLLAAGIPEGPEIGTRLKRALERKLDGEISGRDEELASALE